LAKDAKGAFDIVNTLGDRGKDIREFAKMFTDYLRKIMIVKIMGEDSNQKSSPVINTILAGLTEEDFKSMKRQSEDFSSEDLVNNLEIMIETQNKMKYSTILQLPLELAIIKMVGIKG